MPEVGARDDVLNGDFRVLFDGNLQSAEFLEDDPERLVNVIDAFRTRADDLP